MGDGKRGQEMRTHAKHNRGQSLVEFALVIPILVALMVGIFQFSLALMTKNVMTNAAREGARVQAVGGDGEAEAYRVLNSANIPATANVAPAASAYGSVFADVTYEFPLSVPFYRTGTISLRSTATMRQEF